MIGNVGVVHNEIHRSCRSIAQILEVDSIRRIVNGHTRRYVLERDGIDSRHIAVAGVRERMVVIASLDNGNPSSASEDRSDIACSDNTSPYMIAVMDVCPPSAIKTVIKPVILQACNSSDDTAYMFGALHISLTDDVLHAHQPLKRSHKATHILATRHVSIGQD